MNFQEKTDSSLVVPSIKTPVLVQVVEGREKLREETSEENQPTVVTHNQGNSPNEFLL